MNVGDAPIHDLAKLFPIGDLFELHLLNGSSRDDKSVVIVVLNVVKGAVEGEHMLCRRIL